jgi:glycosyltransferase involved in cell wall biosynthesis
MNEYPQKLADLGVETSVIAARNSTDEPAREEVNGVQVYRILTDTSTAFSVQPTRFGYQGLKQLDEICRQSDVDILHLNAFPNLGAIVSPVPWLESPTVTVADIRHTAVRNRVVDQLSRWALRVQDRLVDRTIAIDEQVGKNIFPNTDDISILPLGADLEAFAPGETPELRESWTVSDDELVIGYTGSLHPPRELHRLINAFVEVHESHPDTRLVIVGDGLDRDRLEKIARDSSARDAIHFTGKVPFEQMPEYVRAFDIGFAYVPDVKQYRDQPLSKTVEFLATGLPVIATDTPGNRIFVENGDNGILVDDDVDSYLSGLHRLIESPDERAALADGARESVSQYDYERIVEDELIPLYRELLDEQ